MEAHDENQLANLLDGALALPEDQRADYLERECVGDGALRQKLEELLRVREKTDADILGSPPRKTLRIDFLESGDYGTVKGSRIGAYELLDLLGEGGFGQVWRAVQKEGVRRQVAVKIIKPGMDTKEVIARFERERQALATMNHPNIAKVFDAGITENLRPYFVMEYVEGGLPLDEYCNKRNLSLEERLGLFIPICDAIQHAHRKQFIHRDLKPENMLVTTVDGKAVPKIIDFGITKALAEEPGKLSVDTGLNRFIGSSRYASPEQLEGLPLDAGTDVYSLGVVLYELITGRRPFDDAVFKNAPDAAIRTIREATPPKPSIRLQRIDSDVNPGGTKRRTPGMRLRNQLQRDEIDCIVLKCLEKESDRRYPSVGDLGEDLQRYLKSEPILARPPSVRYQMQKFWRRYQLLISAGTAVVCLLVVALGLAIALVYKTKMANQELNRVMAGRNDTYDALINTIFFHLFKEIPSLDQASKITIITLFREEVLKQMDHANDLQVGFVTKAGGFYREMKDYPQATNAFTIALEIIRRKNLDLPIDQAACLHGRSQAEEDMAARVFDRLGQNSKDQSRQLLLQAKKDDEEAHGILETNGQELDANLLGDVERHLAGVNRTLGHYALAVDWQTKVSNRIKRLQGIKSHDFAISESDLARIFRESGNWAGAEQHYLQSLATCDASASETGRELGAQVRCSWGNGLLFQGRLEEALDKLNLAMEMFNRKLSNEKDWAKKTHLALAQRSIVLKEFDEAKREIALGNALTGSEVVLSVWELEKVHCAVCLRHKYQETSPTSRTTENPSTLLLAASEDLDVPLALLPAESIATAPGQPGGGSIFRIHHRYSIPTASQVPSPVGGTKSVPLVQCQDHAVTLLSDGTIQWSPE